MKIKQKIEELQGKVDSLSGICAFLAKLVFHYNTNAGDAFGEALDEAVK